MPKTPHQHLPSDPLAALLVFGDEHTPLSEVAQNIESGQWIIDPGYTHNGDNLVTLVGSNPTLRRQTANCLRLIASLVRHGVEVQPGAWLKASHEQIEGVWNPDRTFLQSGRVALFLRGIEEGENLDNMHDACQILNLLRPIKPVIEQAKKTRMLIQKAGGWKKPVQGIGLGAWLALHDDQFRAGGSTQPRENDGDIETRNRIRARVFDEGINNENLPAVERMLMRYRVAKKNNELTLDDPLDGLKPGDASRWLAETRCQGRVRSLMAARLLNMVMEACADEKERFKERRKIQKANLSPWQKDIETCLDITLNDTDHEVCLGQAWITPLLMTDDNLVFSLATGPQSGKRLIFDIVDLIKEGNDQIEPACVRWLNDQPETKAMMLDHLSKSIKSIQSEKAKHIQERLARMEAFLMAINTDVVTANKNRGLRL